MLDEGYLFLIGKHAAYSNRKNAYYWKQDCSGGICLKSYSSSACNLQVGRKFISLSAQILKKLSCLHGLLLVLRLENNHGTWNCDRVYEYTERGKERESVTGTQAPLCGGICWRMGNVAFPDSHLQIFNKDKNPGRVKR